MTQGWRFGVSLVLLWLAVAGRAEPLPLIRVSGPDNQATARFQSLLETGLAERYQFTRSADTPAELTIALGADAFRRALVGRLPVVAVHVPKAELDAAVAAGCLCTGIYRDVLPQVQLQLVKELLPGARRVGIVVSTDNLAAVAGLSAPGILLDVREVSRVEELPAALADLLPRVDVLLGIADARLFTPDTARLILLASYRQQTPLIGPDEAFVRAGSLAAAHPSLEGLASAVIQLLTQVDGDALPAPRHAPSSLTINAHVARSYGVIAPDTAAIEQRLEKIR